MTPEELLNYKKVNYFFMPNFHDVMNNTWWVCRKDRNDDKNQNYCCNQKAFFGLYLTRCLIKLLQFFFFQNCFNYKVWEKKSLRVKTFAFRKRLKNKQIVIPMHRFVTRLALEPFAAFETRLLAKKIKSDAK